MYNCSPKDWLELIVKVGTSKHNLPAQALSHKRTSLAVSFRTSMCHVTYQHKAQKANTQSFQLSGLIQFIISLIQYVTCTAAMIIKPAFFNMIFDEDLLLLLCYTQQFIFIIYGI